MESNSFVVAGELINIASIHAQNGRVKECMEALRSASSNFRSSGEQQLSASCDTLCAQLSQDDITGIVRAIDNIIKQKRVEYGRRLHDESLNPVQIRSVREYKCTNARCNKFVPDDAKFCPQCGVQQLRMICPSCHSPVKAGATYCTQCGIKMVA